MDRGPSRLAGDEHGVFHEELGAVRPVRDRDGGGFVVGVAACLIVRVTVIVVGMIVGLIVRMAVIATRGHQSDHDHQEKEHVRVFHGVTLFPMARFRSISATFAA